MVSLPGTCFVYANDKLKRFICQVYFCNYAFYLAFLLSCVTFPDMNFGLYLTQLRDAAGLKKKEFAQKLEVTDAYVGMIEKGTANPPPTDRLERIAEILKLSPDQKKTLFDIAFQERNRKELSAFKKSIVQDSASEVEYGSDMVKVPILGHCPASPKHWISGEVEGYEVIPRSFLGSRRVYILRVQGDSMDRAGIGDGDMILVDADRAPKNGNIVVARIDHECTIKRFYRTDHTVTLMPDSQNAKHQPVTFTKENLVQIRGVVDSVYLKKVK